MTSARTVSRLSRILALIPYVLSKQGVQVSEVTRRFGYTEAELARDLNTVFVCGLPGYGPGDLMEAYIDEDEVVIDAAEYFARAPRLTSTEALSLLASGMTIIGSGQGSPELEKAVSKLTGAILPEAEAVFSVTVPGESEVLGTLRRAAAETRVVRITYRSIGKEEETVREIEPWTVFATLGNWYLQARCRMVQAQRVFRVDRIRRVEMLETSFQRPPTVPDPQVGYSPSDEDVTARIRLEPAARWVLDYYPVEVVSDDGDRVEILFSAPDAEVPARLLLRLGSRARLLEGDEVAARVREIGDALRRKYG